MRKKYYLFFVLIIFILSSLTFFFFISSSLKKPITVKKNINSQKLIRNPIEVLVENLDVPWDMAFLPDGRLLITERLGKVQLVSDSKVTLVGEINDIKTIEETGLHGIAIDPDFNSNNFVYLYYAYSSDNENVLNKVVRYKFVNDKLIEDKIIVESIPGGIYHDGGRIRFGPDEYLYITTGDARKPSLAQDKNSLAGKILRVNRDGKAPEDNPFVSQSTGSKSVGDPRVYSYGHRNPQGITWDAVGQLWETEHGPSDEWPNCCQDEVNRIIKGGNYGWPNSLGDKVLEGTIAPVLHSGKYIWAPAGMAFVGGKIYFVGLRGKALYSFDPQSPVNTFTKKYVNTWGRLRSVIVEGVDLYISTSNRDGRGVPVAVDDRIIRLDSKLLNKLN